MYSTSVSFLEGLHVSLVGSVLIFLCAMDTSGILTSTFVLLITCNIVQPARGRSRRTLLGNAGVKCVYGKKERNCDTSSNRTKFPKETIENWFLCWATNCRHEKLYWKNSIINSLPRNVNVALQNNKVQI